MKNLSVEYVRNSNEFSLVKELRFNEIISFVLENIRLNNFCTGFYMFINLLFISFLSGQTVYGFMKDVFSFHSYMSSLGWGALAGCILIIPFHEGLHALGFLLIGARKIKFGADFKQMIFYATAADFVAGKRGFSIVALAPFVVINLACLPIAIIFGPEGRVFLTIMLLLHNIMCIGDFGMLSFFMRHKDKEMYTFDDPDTKTAWFYEKVK
jgi:hypothetical protein